MAEHRPLSGAPAEVTLSTRALVVGRAAEQLVLATTGMALAQRVGPVQFAPIGIVLVVSSLALSIADFGVGVRVLRLGPNAQIDRRSLLQVRSINLAAAVVGVVVGALLVGDARVVVAVSGVLWLVSGESLVRKAAALRWGSTWRMAGAEVLGSAVLLAAVAVAWFVPGSALEWTAVGLVGKQAVELMLARPWPWAFGSAARDADWFGVWSSQSVAFVISNVDYLIVGVIAGERALAVYLVAYRLANAIPSQVSFVAGRAVTVDLASGSAQQIQRKYERYTAILFAGGVAGAIGGVLGAPLVASFLGSEWGGTGWALAVLALAAPWRTVLGTAGTLAIVSNGARELLRWELARLCGVVLALVVAALLGFPALLAAVVAVPVVSALVYHRLAGALAGVRPWRRFPAAAVATLVILLIALTLGSDSLSGIS